MESRSSHLDGVKAAIYLPYCVKERGKREKERKIQSKGEGERGREGEISGSVKEIGGKKVYEREKHTLREREKGERGRNDGEGQRVGS